jgi:hypothetical protein
MAYERLLDKSRQPSDGEMAEATGGLSDAWKSLRAFIEANYGIEPVVKFGGKKYGWLVNYRKGGRPLCDLYPEQGAFTALVVLGKKEVEQVEASLEEFSPATGELFQNTPQFHDGRWLWLRLTDPAQLADVQRLLKIKRPIRKPAGNPAKM